MQDGRPNQNNDEPLRQMALAGVAGASIWPSWHQNAAELTIATQVAAACIWQPKFEHVSDRAHKTD
jgi:hypothetical protein